MGMTRGEVQQAERDALHRLDEWNKVTGTLVGGYVGEVESLVLDAVHIGIRSALKLPFIGLEDKDLRKES